MIHEKAFLNALERIAVAFERIADAIENPKPGKVSVPELKDGDPQPQSVDAREYVRRYPV